ncbi:MULTISPECIES: hypothetical protein, partial [Paraburkholderia]|uniref:hypothetical protein n=1 Tax=Paraburkholderia TaxID=1822464 RepID=UPI0032186489
NKRGIHVEIAQCDKPCGESRVSAERLLLSDCISAACYGSNVLVVLCWLPSRGLWHCTDVTRLSGFAWKQTMKFGI